MNSAILQQGNLRGEAATIDPPGASSQHAASAGAVSWAAVVAGAAGAAALSLILLILGTGLGLSAISPFSEHGAAGKVVGVSAILWLAFTQLAASGLGGYLAGRLRTQWIFAHGDEVYFRDTAHGFLAWAVATLVTAATLASAIDSIVGSAAGGAMKGASLVATDTLSVRSPANEKNSAGGHDPSVESYFVDGLFRRYSAANPSTTASNVSQTSWSDTSAAKAEATNIFAAALVSGALPSDDAKYLGELVAQSTGLSPDEADRRVNAEFSHMQAKIAQAKSQAQEAADKARKDSAYAALWLFVSLLLGAFVASLMATFGGRQRDVVYS